MKTLLENQSVLDDLTAGHDPQRIAEAWRPALAAFEVEREKALLYPSH